MPWEHLSWKLIPAEHGPDFPQFRILGKVRKTEVSCQQGSSRVFVLKMLLRHLGRKCPARVSWGLRAPGLARHLEV